MINNIDLEALQSYVALISENPAEAISSYGITATWKGGVQTEIKTANQKVGSKEVVKNFTFTTGEPEELLGDNHYPTPQDYLLGGMAGCMMVGFVAGATARGIVLEHVELKIAGELDLKGFLEVDPDSPVGFREIRFNFHVKGSGSQQDYDQIIKHVQKVSPNYRTITDPVAVSVSRLL
jgi:uncharacterized OsmC-like protein